MAVETDRTRHEPWHRREDIRPAYGHSFWWFMFGNGGAIAAVFLPVTIFVAGILGPLRSGLGVNNWMEDANHFGWVLGNPIIKVFFIVLCFLTFVHAGHRLRFLLFDLGIRSQVRQLEWACYGAAIVGTVVAAVLIVITP